MNEKFSQFFKGKMSKSVYISAVSAVLCGAVAITSTVVVHNQNKKIDSILNNTVSSGSTTESVTESSLSTESNTLQSSSSETSATPSEDKAMQYLKKYDKLTAEYEKKRETLILKQFVPIPTTSHKPQLPNRAVGGIYIESEEEYASRVAQYELDLKKWEEESIRQSIATEKEDQEQEEIKKQIEQLDKKYMQDVENLKREYGIK